MPCTAKTSPGRLNSTMSNSSSSATGALARRVSSERSKEELELAERLIEHSQGIQANNREMGPPAHSEVRRTSTSTDGGSRSTGDGEEQQRGASVEGSGQAQNLSLPSIHELTWIKQRKPFNTGMGGAGQVCRCVLDCRIKRVWWR